MMEAVCSPREGISIGDVAKICGVQAHTIRYWEREFSNILRPVRTKGKQRRYQQSDITRLLQIKKLLWVHKFTIQGAKRVLRGDPLVSLLGGLNVADRYSTSVRDVA